MKQKVNLLFLLKKIKRITVHAIFKRKSSLPQLSTFPGESMTKSVPAQIDYKHCSSESIVTQNEEAKPRIEAAEKKKKTEIEPQFMQLPARNLTASSSNCTDVEIQWQPPETAAVGDVHTKLIAIRVDCFELSGGGGGSHSSAATQLTHQELPAHSTSCLFVSLPERAWLRFGVCYFVSHACPRPLGPHELCECFADGGGKDVEEEKEATTKKMTAFVDINTAGIDSASNLRWTRSGGPHRNRVTVTWTRARIYDTKNRITNQFLCFQQVFGGGEACSSVKRLRLSPEQIACQMKGLRPGLTYRVWIKTENCCAPVCSDSIMFTMPRPDKEEEKEELDSDECQAPVKADSSTQVIKLSPPPPPPPPHRIKTSSQTQTNGCPCKLKPAPTTPLRWRPPWKPTGGGQPPAFVPVSSPQLCEKIVKIEKTVCVPVPVPVVCKPSLLTTRTTIETTIRKDCGNMIKGVFPCASTYSCQPHVAPQAGARSRRTVNGYNSAVLPRPMASCYRPAASNCFNRHWK